MIKTYFTRVWWLQLFLGIPIGVVVVLLGAQFGGQLLSIILGNDIVGLALFGCYLFIVGTLGLANFFTDISTARKWMEILSWHKKSALIAGICLGIAIMASCRQYGMYFWGFVIYALIFIFTGMFFYFVESEILKENHEMTIRSNAAVIGISVLALILGSLMMWEAKCEACKHRQSATYQISNTIK